MPRRSLEATTKKKKPFTVPEQAVVLNILRTNELLQHRFGRLFREYGLTQPQYNILRILRGAGEPLPCLEVAERMVSVVPAITGVIDRMADRELVVKERSEEDRRVWLVRLTRAGRTLCDKLDRPMADLYRAVCGHLTRQECTTLVTLLEKARAEVEPL